MTQDVAKMNLEAFLSPFRAVILLLGGCALFAWSISFLKPQEEFTSSPPSILTAVPCIGHFLAALKYGVQEYFASLCTSQTSPLSAVQLLTQTFYVVNPSDSNNTKPLAKVPEFSLIGAFWVGFGSYLGFTTASRESMMTPDKHVFKRELSKLVRDELMTLRNIREHGSRVQEKLDQSWRETIPGASRQVKLAEWLSDSLSLAVGSVYWGDGAFDDHAFRRSLRVMLCDLRDLYHPLTIFLPLSFRRARDHVRKALSRLDLKAATGDMTVHAGGISPAENMPFIGKVKLLLQRHHVARDGWVDFDFSLIMGVFPNLINMMTWAFWHLTADPELLSKVRLEITNLAECTELSQTNSKNKVIDISRVRDSCSSLMSFWYELLRLYASSSTITRLVTEDAIFSGMYALRRRSFVVAPLRPHHCDSKIWGEEAESFRADRFLNDKGRVDSQKLKKLMTFGLPTVLMCPGRYTVFNVFMLTIIKAVLTFDIDAAPGEDVHAGRVPRPKASFVAGVPEPSYDPELVLTRRGNVESVHVVFDNQKTGW